MPSIAVPAMPNFAMEEPPLFATQGEDVGKKRGRRPRTAADTPDPASGKRGSAPKAKAKAKAMAAKAKAKAKAKACASRGSKQAAPKASSRPAPKVKAKAKASAKSKQGRAKALAVERYRANMALEGEGAGCGRGGCASQASRPTIPRHSEPLLLVGIPKSPGARPVH